MTTAAPSRSSLLTLDRLHFAYPGEPPLVADWSAAIGPGVTLLHGDTGSGKSTLLRVLAGQVPASAGTLTLCGASLPGDAAAYRRHLFFIEPGTDAFDAMTGRDCAQSLRRADVPFDAARWAALVEGFSLAPHIDKAMYMLHRLQAQGLARGGPGVEAPAHAARRADRRTRCGLDALPVAHPRRHRGRRRPCRDRRERRAHRRGAAGRHARAAARLTTPQCVPKAGPAAATAAPATPDGDPGDKPA